MSIHVLTLIFTSFIGFHSKREYFQKCYSVSKLSANYLGKIAANLPLAERCIQMFRHSANILGTYQLIKTSTQFIQRL